MTKDEFLDALTRSLCCSDCGWEDVGLEHLVNVARAEVSRNNQYIRGLQTVGQKADPEVDDPRERLRQLRTSVALTLGVSESAFDGEG